MKTFQSLLLASMLYFATSVAVQAESFHAADTNADYTISLAELLRGIQFFNDGSMHCDSGTEDGYAIGVGATSCTPHSSDYAPTDWSINLGELLRLVQLYNVGKYDCGLNSEDGFAAGTSDCPPQPPQLDELPTSVTSLQMTVTGTTLPGTSVQVVGGASPTTANADQSGVFSAPVILRANRINQLYATAIKSNGVESSPAPIQVLHDATPPSLYIDFPPDGATLSDTQTVVAGRVSDVLSGYQGLSVTINGQAANVDEGIGTNGTFELPQLSLNEGVNFITATATDALGNLATTAISVNYASPTGYTMLKISGDSQQAQVYNALPQPLRVKVKKPNGEPLSGKIVTFKPVLSNGLLGASPGNLQTRSRLLQLATDANGEAQCYWWMGSDAGCGNNRVEVTSTDISGFTYFCATAMPGAPKQINIGSGNNQRLEAGANAPLPLNAWVSDSCNGIGGVPVIFKVTQGNGTINGQSEVTVNTDDTGHAEVAFTLGTEPGNNLVEADFPENPGLPATFNAFGVERNPLTPTTMTGIVLDNAYQPIAGAELLLAVNNTEIYSDITTNEQGQFFFEDIAAGAASLFVDGLKATHVGGIPVPQGSYPTLSYELIIVPNAENSLPTPVLLPALDPANAQTYDGTQDMVLTVQEIEGLEFHIKAGSLTRRNGTKPSPADPQVISLNQVHHDDVPMPMPDGVAPPFAWTLQPAGMTFDPPIEVVYPNMSGLDPGAIAYFLSYNHDTQQFDIAASGHVSEDGSVITTDLGAGLNTAGWGGACPPYPAVGDAATPTLDDCKEKLDDKCERTRGTVAGVLRCQLSCLANAANSESPGWIQNTVKDFSSRYGGSELSTYEQFETLLPSWLLNIPSALIPIGIDANDHFNNDLRVSWTRDFCAAPVNSRDQIRREHNDWLNNAFTDCTLENSDLPNWMKFVQNKLVPKLAKRLREDVFRECDELNQKSIELRLESNSLWKAETPIPLEPMDLFVPDINAEAAYEIRVSGGQVLLQEGDDVALEVRTASGDVEPISDETEFFAVASYPIRIVDINSVGRMTVPNPSGPYAWSRSLLVVVALVHGELAVGQFAVYGEDSDGDLIIDYYEALSGRDPIIPEPEDFDSDMDGLPNVTEFLIASDFELSDTDEDGFTDWEETQLGLSPLIPENRTSLLPRDAQISVGAATMIADVTGGFVLNSLSAPDNDQDGTSDECVQLTGSGMIGDTTYYVMSEPFRIIQGATASIGELTISTEPPATIETLRIEAESRTLPLDGPPLALLAMAHMSDGTTQDVSDSECTTFRTSNPDVVTIGEDGAVVPAGEGVASVTVTRLGVSSTARLTVASDLIRTTFEGFVVDELGNPLSGATVSTPLGSSTITNADGSFTLSLTLLPGTTTVVLSIDIAGQRFSSNPISVVPDGISDAGIITPPEATFETTVEGVVVLEDGTPAAGIPVRVTGGFSAASGGDGSFSIPVRGRNSDREVVRLVVSAEDSNVEPRLQGRELGLVPIPDGVTQAGEITLLPSPDEPLYPGASVVLDNRLLAVDVIDADGDFLPDLVVSGASNSRVNYLHALGSGEFEVVPLSPPTPSVGNIAFVRPSFDALPDIVSADEGRFNSGFSRGFNGTSVSLWRNAAGEFPARENLVLAGGPSGIAWGDLDYDGFTDLAVTRASTDNMSLYLGDGLTPYVLLNNVSTGDTPLDVAMGDVNSDGNADIVTANAGTFGGTVNTEAFGGTTLSIFLGDGTGAFEAPLTQSVAQGPVALEIVDATNDGINDIVVACHDADSVTLLPGLSNGTLGSPVTFAAPDTPEAVTVARASHQEQFDIFVAGSAGNAVAQLRALGDGNFGETVFYPATDPRDIALADVNVDALPDLITVSRLDQSVTVNLGDADGGFIARTDFDVAGQQLAKGDMNEDGVDDAVAMSSTEDGIWMLLSQPDGTLSASFTDPSGARAIDFVVAELDGDSYFDVLAFENDSTRLAFYKGNGDGTVDTYVQKNTVVKVGQVAVSDIDQDGDIDAVTSTSTSVNVSVFLNDGSANFSGPTSYALTYRPALLLTANINGDEYPEVIAGGDTSAILSVLNGSAGAVLGTPLDYTLSRPPVAIAAIELGQPGFASLVVSHAAAQSNRGSLTLLRNDGTGTLTSETLSEEGVLTNDLSVGDANGDGLEDIFAAQVYGGVAVYLQDSETEFNYAGNYSTGTNCSSIITLDANSDGRADLVTTNTGSGNTSYLPGQ